MKKNTSARIIAVVILVLVAFAANTMAATPSSSGKTAAKSSQGKAKSKSAKSGPSKSDEDQIHVSADALISDRNANYAEFQGNVDPHYTFDNFVVGKCNQMGHAMALQVAKNPGKAYNPLLLYGGSGLGKTHLMYAAGNLMRQNSPGMRVMYLRSEQFFSAMMKSLQEKSMDQFKRQFQQVDALLIDDIQFFAGKNTTQEEFFHTFNALHDGQQGVQVGNVAPDEVEWQLTHTDPVGNDVQCSGRTMPGRPTAATRMSAWEIWAARSGVWL